MQRLLDRTVLVTGASRGIGKAIAVGMAEEGADLIVNFHTDEEGAERTVAEVEERGRKATAVRADVSKVEEVTALLERTEEVFGRLDVLVNNAAITGWSSLLETTEAEWDRVVDTNLKGPFFAAVHAARLMRETGGGTIVNVSSNVGARGVRNLAVYGTSKGGLNAMTRQLAVELAPHGIRVNAFAPGPTGVARNFEDDPDYGETWGSVVPMERIAEPAEMVGPAVFLASEESAFVTGQVFYADGGWTAAGRAPEGYMDEALTDAEEELRASARESGRAQSDETDADAGASGIDSDPSEAD